MKLAFDLYESLLLINKNLTREIFIEQSGVRDGYSLNMFQRMYDSIFSELINVDEEFNRYYAFEYPSLENYLWKKFNLKAEQINALMEERRKNPDCILFRKDDNSYGDYGLAQFTFSDKMYERVTGILMLKQIKK